MINNAKTEFYSIDVQSNFKNEDVDWSVVSFSSDGKPYSYYSTIDGLFFRKGLMLILEYLVVNLKVCVKQLFINIYTIMN
ncbi:hypothetical protein SMBr_37080 [Shewanella sp. M-Br]|nr:hypothetical protein SMBr_37080 [Shewanella sp. M-Br]